MKDVQGLRYKRTLFVGLGGAGTKTLRELKKKISAANGGKIPDQIKFLLIDTNATELANFRDFDCSEKICIAVREPYQRWKHDKGLPTHAFIPPQNTHSLLALERGAGQIRSNGHFAVIENQYSDRLIRTFRDKADDIASVDIDGKTLERDPKIEIRLVFSLAGGTGSGTFLPIATLLRAAIKQCELTAYIYSSTHYELFVENSAKNSVMQNAYAALVELDYMMHYGRKDKRYNSISFNFGPDATQQITQSNRPFEEVYYIDKRTSLPTSESIEFAYIEQKRLQENTAETMHLAATNIITAHTGTIDNVRQKIMEGQFDVGDKFAWMSGVGLAELYLNRLDTQNEKVLSMCNQAISARIEKEQVLPNEVINQIATEFIGTYRWDESQGEKDQDPILSHFGKMGAIRRECADRIKSSNQANPQDSSFGLNLDQILLLENTNKSEISQKLTREFQSQLLSLVKEIIDGDSFNNKFIAGYNGNGAGISFAVIITILERIKGKLDLSINKLSEEQKEHIKLKENAKKEAREIRQRNVPQKPSQRTFIQRLFNTAEQTEDNVATTNSYSEELQEKQTDYLYNEILSERDESTIAVFKACQGIIDAHIGILNNWIKMLSKANAYGRSQLNNVVRKDEQSKKKENRVEVQMMDIQSGFRLKYDELESIYMQYANETLQANTFDTICHLLKKASGSLQAYLAAGLAELKRLDKENKRTIERTECQKKIDKLIDLSTPTMQIDRHGYGDQVKADQFWYIMTECEDGISNGADSQNSTKDMSVGELLKQFIEQNTQGDKVYTIHVPGWKDKAILYRVISAVPVYFVEGVCESELGGHTLEGCYEKMKKLKHTYSPFSHEILRRKLENAIAVLKPYDETSEEIALEHWINFQLLSQKENGKYILYVPSKKVKRTEGTYSILSEMAGEYLTTDLKDRKKILLLGENRLEAYETFCRFCKTIIDEHPEYLEKVDSTLYPEEYEELFIMSAEQYMDKVLPLWRELHYDNDDPEFLLIKKEMNFVDKRYKKYKNEKNARRDLKDIVDILSGENNE